MFSFTNADIRKAYLFLKNYFYHDSIDILAKQQIAQYESQHKNLSIDVFWQQIEKDVKERYQYKNFDIGFYVVPKNIQNTTPKAKGEEELGTFLHNVKEQDIYRADKFSYFIKADVPTRVLDVLWIMKVGTQVDQTFDNQHIYANRLSPIHELSNEKAISPIFKFYAHQYSAWRDKALDTAKKLLDNGNNILMLSMDIKQCFYNIHIDWNKFQQQFTDQTDLTICLQQIHTTYFRQIFPFFQFSHSELEQKPILPIGLLSSGILANWHLKNFDDDIISSSNPIFYGRYVDDILLVRTIPGLKASELECQEAFKACFSKEIFEGKDAVNIHWKTQKSIQIQKEKLIVHYFDAKHSAAGLKVFEKEINKNNSLFRFLPTTETQPRLEDVAYDLFYYGSKYKFRSFINFKENATKFSTYLSGQIILNRLTNNKKNDSVIEDVKLFFKGRNCLDFYRFWSKFFYFLVIRKEYEAIWAFYQDIKKIISKTISEKDDSHYSLTKKTRESLLQILDISLSLALALNPEKTPQHLQHLQTIILDLQQSNLFVNTYVKDPLINFTLQEKHGSSYLSSQLKEDSSLDNKKLRLSPRFIHLDEFILFKIWPHLLQNKPIKNLENIFDEYKNYFGTDYQKENIVISESDPSLNITVKDSIDNRDLFTEKIFSQSIRIGLVNMSIDFNKDTLPCIEKQGKFPNLSEYRQNTLYDIINLATKENVNLLIFPELSIPVSWLPAMLYHSRKTQIGFIFGLEYAYNTQTQEAYNYVVTTLPFIHNKYKTVLPLIRLKNHYAPEEKKILEGHKYKIPKSSDLYHLCNWNGMKFTTFICYELADIIHRSFFKLKIDLLACCVNNKDVNYYNHMLLSTARDLSCYVAQVNVAQYGGSGLIQPAKTVLASVMNIKGGKNATILVDDLNIQEIQKHHAHRAGYQHPIFKPIPPTNEE